VDEIPVSELTKIQELNSLETWEGNSGPQVLDLQVCVCVCVCVFSIFWVEFHMFPQKSLWIGRERGC
jgi:hypothetical protein